MHKICLVGITYINRLSRHLYKVGKIKKIGKLVDKKNKINQIFMHDYGVLRM